MLLRDGRCARDAESYRWRLNGPWRSAGTEKWKWNNTKTFHEEIKKTFIAPTSTSSERLSGRSHNRILLSLCMQITLCDELNEKWNLVRLALKPSQLNWPIKAHLISSGQQRNNSIKNKIKFRFFFRRHSVVGVMWSVLVLVYVNVKIYVLLTAATNEADEI